MMRIPRPSHPTVVAYLALFAALGGSAYAVSKVGTNDLKRSAVTSAKIKNKTIKGADVRNHAVGGKQINESTLTLGRAVQSKTADTGGCTVTGGSPVVCATTTDVKTTGRRTQVIAVAYGSYSGAGSSIECELQGAGGLVGANTVQLRADGAAADGFSLAAAGPLDPGVRNLSLVCSGNGTATIVAPKIRMIAFAPERAGR